MIENDTLKAFEFDIHLPDESSPLFYIFHDLAELFGDEFNKDALKRLKKYLRNDPNNPKGKLSSDYEADNVSLSASKSEVIFLAAKLINEHSIDKYRKTFSDEEYGEIQTALRGWKRRKPKKWLKGDIFCFKIESGQLCYGQVLAKEHGSPTCCLFECKSDAELSVQAVTGNRIISILHVGSDLLDRGVWRIIGNCNVLAESDEGPFGSRFDVGSESYGSGKAIQDLAEAYFGIKPWNVGYCGDDEYFDKQLMNGIVRPDDCLILGEKERIKYRKKHGITA